MNALIVDDSKAQRLVIRTYMTELGFNVTEAAEGFEALQILKIGSKFDVLLVNWTMPGMNGLEFIQSVRSEPSNQDTPIIMISVQDSSDRIQQALQAGADEYMIKPITRDDLKSKLELLGIEPE